MKLIRFYVNFRQRNRKFLASTSSDGKKTDPVVLAPETSSLTSTDGASISSRTRISETLGSKSSTIPPTAPTQSQQDTMDILELDSLTDSSQLISTACSTQPPSSKRARSPSDTEEMPPPRTKARLESLEQTPAVPQTESMRFSSSAATLASQNSEKSEKENRRVPAQEEEREEEEDMFGFASIRSSRKRSQPLQSQSRNKRFRPDDDDDIFGFNEIKKEIGEDSEPLEFSFTRENTETERVESVEEDSRTDRNKNIQQSVRRISEGNFSSTGFLARDDVKLEVKGERPDSGNGDVDDITDLVKNKITLGSLVRTKKAKPSYVAAAAPSLCGKPVTNYKKFRKQALNTSKAVVGFTKYVPSRHDQTGVDDWLRENTNITVHEREQEEAERQSENLWNFDTIAIGKKNYRKK